MRLPFFNPHRDEVATIATDLITRFGFRAHNEASYLAELALQMGSRRKKVLYEHVAHEIEASFLEAQRRLDLRQNASDPAHLDAPAPEQNGGRAEPITTPTADVPKSLLTELNFVDTSPRRRFASG
jgi:hypothetical protein